MYIFSLVCRTAAQRFAGGPSMASMLRWRPLLVLKDPTVLKGPGTRMATIQPVFGLVDCCNEALLEVLEVFLRQSVLEAPCMP